MVFSELTKKDFLKAKKILSGKYENSEASLTSMYIWQHYYNSLFCFEDDILYTIYDKHGQHTFEAFMPYGKMRNSEFATDKLLDYFKKNFGTSLTINLATEDYLDFLLKSKKYNIIYKEVPNSFDYVYKISDLIELSGKKYHSKKNHFNTFTNKYNYRYVVYDASMYEKCMQFCQAVVAERTQDDIKSYNSEMESIRKAFDAYEELGLVCSLIMIDDEIIALSVAEKLTENYALIQIEKASYEYRDAYPVINRLTLKNEFSHLDFVNREEDLGIAGLRKAKQSYHPCKMIKKYKIEFLDF